MLKFLLAGACALAVTMSAAEARPRQAATSPECNITMPCIGVAPPPWLRSAPAKREAKRGAPVFNLNGTMQLKVTKRPKNESIERAIGIDPTLAGKVSSIQAACPGTQIISGLRHTKVAGTRRWSLHASGKAVDVRGPYGCIYAQLRGGSGGYSTDAGRVNHIHISYDAAGGREMGIAFKHGGRKFAKRHKARYAHRHRARAVNAHGIGKFAIGRSAVAQ